MCWKYSSMDNRNFLRPTTMQKSFKMFNSFPATIGTLQLMLNIGTFVLKLKRKRKLKVNMTEESAAWFPYFFQVVLLDLHILITPGSAINGFKIIPSIWPGVRQMRNASLWEVPWPQFMMRRPTTSLCLRCQQSPMLEDTRWMATGSGLMDLLGAIQTGILANLAVETFLRSSMVGDSQSGMQWRDLGE